jgi:hypothetical protein
VRHPGTSTISVVDNFKLYADGIFRGTGTFRQVFTAAESGRSVMVFAAGQTIGLEEPIQNPDGTVTVITTSKGLPERRLPGSAPHGPWSIAEEGGQ